MRRVTSCLALVGMLAGGGCSVFMAANGREGTDLSGVSKDVSRVEVENVLGAPIETRVTTEGEWATYKYIKPNKAAPGRAVAHGVMDVLTLGIWEVAGTPIEAVGDDKVGKISVLYDPQTQIVMQTNKLD